MLAQQRKYDDAIQDVVKLNSRVQLTSSENEHNWIELVCKNKTNPGSEHPSPQDQWLAVQNPFPVYSVFLNTDIKRPCACCYNS